MKKIMLALTVVAVMAMSLVGCGTKEEVGTFTFDLPEGFVEDEENSTDEQTVYLSVEGGGSIIGYNILDAGKGVLDYVTPEKQEVQLENALKQQGAENTNVEMIDSKKYKIDGHDAFRYECEYEIQGMPMKAIQVMVETGDIVHCVTFTDVNNNGYYDAFLESADSIRFE